MENFELKIGNSCGSCIHTKAPKKPREHAAHYEVANTERWCYKFNRHVSRECTCAAHEGINRSAKRGLTMARKYNERMESILKLVTLIGDKTLKGIYSYDIIFVKDGWLYQGRDGFMYQARPVGVKDGSTSDLVEFLLKQLNDETETN